MSDQTAPSVCIVLINWNQLQLTLDCVQSLMKMTYPNYRIVVVDNNSSQDPSNSLLELNPQLILLKQSDNLGFAEGNNVGFRYAFDHGFELIMALNNDTVVDPDFLWPMIESLKHTDSSLAAVSPKIYFKHAPKTIWSLGGKVSVGRAKGYSYRRKTVDQGQFTEEIMPDYLTGCCLLIKTEILQRLGGFNRDYFAYYEDTDFSLRLRENNYEIKVIPKSVIWHVAGGSSRTLKKKPPFLTYLGTRNRLMFFKTHMKGLKRFYTLTYIVIETVFAIIFRLITFQLGHAKMEFAGLKDGINYVSK